MALAFYGFLAPKRRIEPAGISYEFSRIKDLLALGLSTLPVLRIVDQNLSGIDEIDGTGVGGDLQENVDWLDKEDAKFSKYIARLDPNEWKKQDHYKLLGLSKLRYQATAAQLKAAYRRKVLKYHPDKGRDKSLRTEAVFACIQKAYEQLGLSEERRRAYDSVDPDFDDSVPDSVDESANFFAQLGPVFERNARFSVNQPVPLLGDEHSDRSHVEHFYDFWFDWRSWREFSYLDSEDKAKGEDRWERREIEKQNKAEREKRRKRDLRRVSALVELAYAKDPRVAQFKEDDKRAKNAHKERKRLEREARERAEAEERCRAEAEAARESEARAEEQRRATQAKQQRKKAMACQRRRLREIVSATNCWTQNGTVEDHRMMTPIMEQIERVCLSAKLDELTALCEGLTAVRTYDEAHKLMTACARKEQPVTDASGGGGTTNGMAPTPPPPGTNSVPRTDAASSKVWSSNELQLLVKAVNLYAPGTQERWKQVAEYVSTHGSQQRTERDVISQVKLLKSNPTSNSAPAVRTKNAETNTAATTTTPSATDDQEWSAEQQKQLERALKATVCVDAKERWDQIAAMVDGKDRKECIRRYKMLAEMVKKAKTGSAANNS